MQPKFSRRAFLRAAALTVAATGVAACAPAATPAPAPTSAPKPAAQPTAAAATKAPAAAAPAAGKKNLTVFWRTNPREIETMNAAFKAYMEKNPNISVTLIDTPAGSEADAKLQATFAAGTPPEIFASVFSAGMVDYIYKDMCVDLRPFIDRDKFDQSVFFPEAVQRFQYSGKQFGVPRGGIPTVVFYNKDLFDKAGLKYPPTNFEDPSWTWDVMVEYAKKLTVDTDKDGKIDEWGIIAGWTNASCHSMAWGKRILADDAVKYGITEKHNFRDPAVIEAWQKTADLIHVHKVSPKADVAQSVGGFASGKVGMWISLGNYAGNAANKFKWSAAALPRGIPNVQQRSTTFTGPLMMGRGCANLNEGWDLLKYLVSEEGQKYLAQGAVVGTSRRAMVSWWLGQFGAPGEELVAVQESGYKVGWETANTQTARWGEIQTLITSEMDPLMLGEKKAEQCVDSLAPKLDKLLASIYADNKAKAKQLFPDFPG